MKVYLAYSEEGYDGERAVLHVFARREDAEAYEFSADVDEFEVDEGPVEIRTWHRLEWMADLPDETATVSHRRGNPVESQQPRDFDGDEQRVEYGWHTLRWGDVLLVEGWDLDRIRKVYSEQRAQHIARQDMGVEET